MFYLVVIQPFKRIGGRLSVPVPVVPIVFSGFQIPSLYITTYISIIYIIYRRVVALRFFIGTGITGTRSSAIVRLC